MTARRALLIALAAGALSACDDQIKYVPFFSTMATQPSVEAFEEAAPRAVVPGTMPIDGQRTYGLLEADTALSSPLAGTAAELAHGQELYQTFCVVCHGAEGAGDGSVVGPNRIPPLPLLEIRSQRTAAFSDGYIWGMITNGRGLMPSYKRIPAAERWYIVGWVRELQRQAGNAPAGRTAAAPGGDR